MFIDTRYTPALHVVIYIALIVTLLPCIGFAQSDLIQIREDFSVDPRWEGVKNRVVGENVPVVRQDFGWGGMSRTVSTSGGGIGGRIWSSAVPAYYVMPIGKPLTFKDKISASGKLSISAIDHRGTVYIGFFNSERQEWRPLSSMAFRFTEEDRVAQAVFDFMTADWQACGFETDVMIHPDKSVHTWSFIYDPEVTINTVWADPHLKGYLTDNWRDEEKDILERALKHEPNLTLKKLRQRLESALDQGLVHYFHRHGMERWWLRSNPESYKGMINLQIDGKPYKEYVPARFHDAPMNMDSFGIFNKQLYGQSMDFHISEITVQGCKIDLSTDPQWVGKGNRGTYHSATLHSAHDYGFSQTNWAGESPGEIGGLFWRIEPNDPTCGYYADNIGSLTLNDPISFSGSIAFVAGTTDAAMYFGYFNSKEQVSELPDLSDGGRINQSMGIGIMDSSAYGYQLQAFCYPHKTLASRSDGPVFVPDQQRHSFIFRYDPEANNGIGRIAFTFDDKIFNLDLTPEQRKNGAFFDRFGLATFRRGGNCVTVYFDDLTYTARRDNKTEPVKYIQEITKIPYPKNGGRAY